MLTPDQKTAIDRHLRKENWLLNKDLIAELTDHYTEGVEERLTEGLSLEAALREIHAGFGGRKGLLKMEEDYQIQQYHQLDRMEWQLIQSFTHGSRWFVSVGVFVSLFLLNTWLDQREMVESVSLMGLFYVGAATLGNLLRSIVLFYRSRHEINAASIGATSPLFVGLYITSFLLLLANKYLFASHNYDFSFELNILLNTVLEALCTVYYIAIVVVLRRAYLTNRKNRLTNAA